MSEERFLETDTTPIRISNTEAHLWYIFPEAVTNQELLRSWFEMLSDEEKGRQQKFVFEKDRHLFLVAHAFVRTCLSRYCEVTPEQWVFSQNKYGKPFIDCSHLDRPFNFSLSHTQGLIACLVTVAHQVGVDVEHILRKDSKIGIAERYFTQEEVNDILSYPSNERAIRFYEYWTLKEAYIKAKGMGLSIPLHTCRFQISDSRAIQVVFDREREDDPKRWKFDLYRINPGHICAVAIECEKPEEMAIKSHCPIKVDTGDWTAGLNEA
jgi:4'-phosphopantetheinyl transferase